MNTATVPPAGESLREEFMVRLFTELQVARFNEIYYQTRARTVRRQSIFLNAAAALASSAALLGTLKAIPLIGTTAAATLMGVAAVAAAVGPVLGLEAKASQLEKAALGYSFVRDRVKRLLNDLKLGAVEPIHVGRDREIEAFRSALAPLDEPADRRVTQMAWKQALEEYPSDSAWNIP